MKTLSRIFLAFALVFTCSLSLVSCHSFAEVPHLINYQGKLANADGASITGTKSIVFRIYNVSSGGTPLWEETQSVTADKGIFNVLLGSAVSLNLAFDEPYYLAIKVESDAEMSPRQRITSSGYALRAENADTLKGIEVSATPEANKLLPLDSNSKVPMGVLGLKVYDSGWFDVTGNHGAGKGETHTLTHNLGTTKLITILYFATDSSGTKMQKITDVDVYNGRGGIIMNITPTTLQVQLGDEGYVAWTYSQTTDHIGEELGYTSGCYKVIAIALE